MGIADTIPGVSGGTIAFITGIYERLVQAIASLDPGVVYHLPRLGTRDGRRSFVADLRAMDVLFLGILGAGILTAVVTISRVIAFALANYRAPMNAFFFGLIAASAIVLYKEIDVTTARRGMAAVGGFVFAFVLTGITAGGVLPHSLSVIFFSGAVTSSAMLLPGISGAALLYILGQYEFMIVTLRAFTDGLISLINGGSMSAVLEPGVTVVTFLAGVAIGLISVAHAVRWALARSRILTLTILVSLMVGSLRLPVTEILENTDGWTTSNGSLIIGAMLAGAVVVLALDLFTDDLDYV